MNRTLAWTSLFLFATTLGRAAPPPVAKLTSASAPYLHRDFCAALVVHPNRIASSPLGNSISLDAVVKASFKESGFQPRQYNAIPSVKKIRRVSILIEAFPGGNVMFMPAGIVEFNEDIDGQAILRAVWPNGVSSTADTRIYRTGTFMAKVQINAAAVDPRTVLIAPEPTLEKMLSKNPALRNVLRKQLESVTTVGDIHVEYNSGPALSNLSKLTGLVIAGRNLDKLREDPEMDDWSKAVLFDAKSLSMAFDLTGEKLLQASADCGGFDEAARLERLLQTALRDLGTLANAGKLPKDMPRQAVEDIIPIMKDTSLRTKVTRKADKLDIELPMPRRFQPFLVQTAISIAKEAGIPNVQPFQEVAGTWEIRYTNGIVRGYTIEADGTLKHANKTFQLKKTNDGVLLTYPSKDRELLSVVDGKLHVKRYNFPSVRRRRSRFPGKPTVTGTGERKPAK